MIVCLMGIVIHIYQTVCVNVYNHGNITCTCIILYYTMIQSIIEVINTRYIHVDPVSIAQNSSSFSLCGVVYITDSIN